MARIQYRNSTGVKLYWGWDEISLCTDLLDRGQRAIVPTPEKKKKEILEQLRAADLGVEMCQKKVHNFLLSPITSKQIEYFDI